MMEIGLGSMDKSGIAVYNGMSINDGGGLVVGRWGRPAQGEIVAAGSITSGGDINASGKIRAGGISIAPVCRSDSTPWNDEGHGRSIYLDRHNVACRDNEFLKQFQLQWNQNDRDSKIRYSYTCCKFPS